MVESGLWIHDDNGARAGMVHLNGDWPHIRELVSPGEMFGFIKLSQRTPLIMGQDPAWDEETKSYKGAPGAPAINQQERVDGEEMFDDETVYDTNICWCLYNVLLIKWVDGVAYRGGLGQVHVHAFDNARPEWRAIALG